MGISKEVRLGLLVTISLGILFIGYYFLKGADLFSNNNTYYCYYESVNGLLESANVQVHGLNVGHVTDIELDGKRVKITLQVQKNVLVTKGSVATMAADGLIGGKVIRLDLAEGSETLQSKSVLTSSQELGIVDNLGDKVAPLMAGLTKAVSTLDTVIAGINLITNADNRAAITATLKSINATADNLSKLTSSLASQTSEINSIVHNANSITTSFAKSNDTIKHILSNFNSVSNQLANANLQKTFTELHTSVTQLQGIMSKVNNNEGSLGMLINNKDLYNNMNSSLKSLDQLMVDLKAHPSRYINVTVFGKKKKD